jgi:hypothetical protein
MKQILTRWFWCLLEYLMLCPVILLIAGFSLPGACVVPFIVVLPFHTLFAVLITSVLKRFKKILTAFIGVVYTTGVSWLWVTLFHIETIEGTMVTAAATGILFVYGIRAGTAGSLRESFYYTIGLLLHAASVFLTHQAPLLMPYQTVSLVLAFLFVLGGLPLANRRFLIRETQEKSSLHVIPGTVLRGNRIILIMLLAGIILLSFWKTFLDALVYLTEKVAELIGKLLMWLARVTAPTEQPQGGGQLELPPIGPTNPVMSLIQDIITYILVLLVVFIILRFLIKNFKRFYAAITSWFSSVFGRFRKWSGEEQGYVDKQESLLKTETHKRSSFLARLFQREPKWRDMKDNISKVRFLYARFVLDRVRKGFNFNQSETPSETIDRIQGSGKDEKADHDSLRNAYQQARYGNTGADDETVKALKDAYL